MLKTCQSAFKLASVLALSIALTAVAVRAQTDVTHQIGLQFSGISGHGLNYQLQVDRFGFECGGYVFLEQEDQDDLLEYNLGTELQYSLMQRENIRTYGLIGVNFHSTEETEVIPSPGGGMTFERRSQDFTTGIGMGCEVVFFDHLALNLDLGYAYTNSDGGAYKETQAKGAVSIGYRF